MLSDRREPLVLVLEACQAFDGLPPRPLRLVRPLLAPHQHLLEPTQIIHSRLELILERSNTRVVRDYLLLVPARVRDHMITFRSQHDQDVSRLRETTLGSLAGRGCVEGGMRWWDSEGDVV